MSKLYLLNAHFVRTCINIYWSPSMKKQLLLLLFLIYPCLCGCFKRIIHLSKQITRNPKLGHAHVYKKQLKLLNTLKEIKTTDDIPNDVLQAAVDGLHKGNNFPLLEENIVIIDKALDAFMYKRRISQFRRTLLVALRNIENENYAKGFLYEIECAVKIEKETNQAVVSFEKPFTSSNGSLSRRFDLVTSENGIECACECKNINWQRLASHSKKLKTQLFEQKQIIDTKKGMIYRFYSKNPIPKKWQQWLQKNNIEFTDTIN